MSTADSDVNVIYWHKRVREQIIDALEQDLHGEAIMKEVWEECETDAQYECAKSNLQSVIDLIRADINDLR